jgi:hypothetical protein
MSASIWQGANGSLMREFARHGRPVVLDMSNDRHYAYIRQRWEADGRTSQRTPRLFRALEQTRVAHKRSGAPPPMPKAQTAGPIATVTGIGFEVDEGVIEAIGSAVYSVPGGTNYSGLSIQLAHADTGEPIGYPEIIDDFAAGIYQPIQSSGIVASQDILVAANFTVAGTVSAELVAKGAAPLTIVAQNVELGDYPAKPPLSSAPIQKGTREVDYVLCCLVRSRGDDMDCDYGPTGLNALAVPISGGIRYRSSVVTPFTSDNAFASLALVSRKIGGGPIYPGDAMQGFNVHNDGQSMTWEWAPAVFADKGMFEGYDYVDLALSFGVTTTNSPNLVYAFVSSALTVVHGPNTEKLLPLQFATGCVAAGTPVTLADGGTVAIEALRPGDRLRARGAGKGGGGPLTVLSSSSGPELRPIVWLRTDDGLELMLTEGHPVVLADDRVLVADDLALQDTVVTVAGPRRILALERRRYNGLVWNIKLGTEEERRRAGIGRGACFYAGGLLVGDAGMQATEGERRAQRPTADVLARLPREWHDDYLATMEAVGR